MEAAAHIYTTFAPVAVGLLAASAILATAGDKHVLRKRVPVVAALWLMSSIAVITLVVATSSAESHVKFVAQRDIGYWVGAAVSLAVLFVTCIALAYAAPLMRARPIVRFLGLAVASAWLFLAAPQVFMVGWVAGCAALWYPSCM